MGRDGARVQPGGPVNFFAYASEKSPGSPELFSLSAELWKPLEATVI